MTWGVVLRDLILGASAFSGGLAIWLAFVNLRAALGGDSDSWGFVAARLSYAGIVLLVAEAVFGAPELPVAWRTVLYAVLTILGLVGFVGILRQEQRERRRPPPPVAGGGVTLFTVIIIVMAALLWATAHTVSAAEQARFDRQVQQLRHEQRRVYAEHERLRTWVEDDLAPWIERQATRQAEALPPSVPEPVVEPLPSPPPDITPSPTPTPSSTETTTPSPTCIPLVDVCL